MTDATHHINESADKITLKTKVKRGTGTRDEDKLDVKVKGDNPDSVAGRLRKTLDALEREGIATKLRETQAGGDNGG